MAKAIKNYWRYHLIYYDDDNFFNNQLVIKKIIRLALDKSYTLTVRCVSLPYRPFKCY